MSKLFTSTLSFTGQVYDGSVSKECLLFEVALLHDDIEEAAMMYDPKEKLARYHHEAEVARLTRGQWRKYWSSVLHQLADRLEPPAKVGRQVQVR
jgi:hypothetical protein